MAVLVLCMAGISAVSAQVRCVDAAREAARLAARGDDGASTAAVRAIAPVGAALQMRRVGGFVIATVAVAPRTLPGLTIRAEAVSAVEPTG